MYLCRRNGLAASTWEREGLKSTRHSARNATLIEDSLGRGKIVILQLSRFLKVQGVRRKVHDQSARELVYVRRPTTRCVPQLVHTFRKPSCFLRQYRYRLPGFSPRLAALVREITPADSGSSYW